eukprot:scaffold41623_cov56-Phaeocystis_antarctica.AAC.2
MVGHHEAGRVEARRARGQHVAPLDLIVVGHHKPAAIATIAANERLEQLLRLGAGAGAHVEHAVARSHVKQQRWHHAHRLLPLHPPQLRLRQQPTVQCCHRLRPAAPALLPALLLPVLAAQRGARHARPPRQPPGVPRQWGRLLLECGGAVAGEAPRDRQRRAQAGFKLAPLVAQVQLLLVVLGEGFVGKLAQHGARDDGASLAFTLPLLLARCGGGGAGWLGGGGGAGWLAHLESSACAEVMPQAGTRTAAELTPRQRVLTMAISAADVAPFAGLSRRRSVLAPGAVLATCGFRLSAIFQHARLRVASGMRTC